MTDLRKTLSNVNLYSIFSGRISVLKIQLYRQEHIQEIQQWFLSSISHCSKTDIFKVLYHFTDFFSF